MMDLINAVGAISGCSSILGFLALIVKLGEWKARQEERLASHGKRIDAIENKHDSLMLLLSNQSAMLAEIKAEVQMLLDDKRGKKKNG